MNTNFATRLAIFIFALSLTLAYATTCSAQISTNGNGGTTDVGTWYVFGGGETSDWSSQGVDFLPLTDWSSITGSSALSGTYQTYSPEDSTIISEDMAELAAAKIDFILIDLTNDTAANISDGCSSTDWPVVWACDVVTAVNAWDSNPSNTWKIRYAIAVCPPNQGSAEGLAAAVYSAFVINSSFGGVDNAYQIYGYPLLVNFGGPNTGSGPSSGNGLGSSFCSGACGDFYFGNASQQGAGEWGWAPMGVSTHAGGTTQVDTVDSANVVEHVSPGWFNQGNIPYQGFDSIWTPREDGTFYEANWDVVYANTTPRVVLLPAYNDWLEAQALGNGDTATATHVPSPVYFMYDSGNADPDGAAAARMVESWTFPDQNIHFDGYWNYTTAAICYLRNGNSSTECSSSASLYPALPQAAPNLAVSATATASSCALGGCSVTSFQASNANDGNPGSAWSSKLDSSADTTESLTLTWGSAQTFNTVVLVGRDVPLGVSNGFPVTFEIDAYLSGGWTKLIQETNFAQPTIPGQPLAFSWGSTITTTQVRVVATTLGLDPGGNYYFQLGELEVLNEADEPTMPVLANWGFEQPAQSGPDSEAHPAGGSWTFSGSAGVQEVGSSYDSPMAPQGIQTAYLTGSASVSQNITLPAGSYTIRFLVSETDGGSQSINVSYGSTSIGSFGSFPSTGFGPYVTSSFTSTGTDKTITFTGAGSGTAFLDEVQIFNQSSISLGSGEQTEVSLSPEANNYGIYTDGTPFSTGGLDGGGTAYSANLLGSSLSLSGTNFSFLSANTQNAIKATGAPVITLPSASYSTLSFLGAAVNGNQVSQNFKVTYSDSSQTTFTQSMSDWCTPESYTGETEALATSYRDTSSGGEQAITCNLYEYSFALNNAKTLSSVTMPNNSDVTMLAMTLDGGSGSSGNLFVNPTWGTGDLTDWSVAYAGGGSPSDASISTNGSGSQFYFPGESHELWLNSNSGAFEVAAYQTATATAGLNFTLSVYAQTSPLTAGAGLLVQDGPGGTTLCSTSIPANISNWALYLCTGTVPTDGQVTVSLFNNESTLGYWTMYTSPSLVVN